MLNRSSNRAKTWVVVGVGALVLALSAFFILSNFPPDSTFAHDPGDARITNFHDADNNNEPLITHIHYPENGMDPVQTFTSEDPEGAEIQWDIMGTDAAAFTISGGVLMFKKSLDYEKPTDGGHTAGTDAQADRANPANNNEYVMFVRATEVRRSGYKGPAKSSSVRVAVIVEDMEEQGMVTIDLRQPEIGVPLTASATDLDGAPDQTLPVTDMSVTPQFQWARSKVSPPDTENDNHWTNIDAATNATYTPVLADNDRYLRVQATYEDRRDTGKMANGVTEFRVREALLNNGSPDIIDDGMRTIAETAMVDDMVGAAIDVSEPNPEDQGKLTFALVSAAEPTSSTPELGINVDARADDINYFAIDKATGQISVKGKLDYEAGSPPDGDGAAGVYVVRVTVRDPSGAPLKAIDVTITVTDVNEPPMIAMTGASEISIAEHPEGNMDDYILLADDQTNRYTETDQQLHAVNWSLEGEDAGDFDIEGVVGVGEANQRKLDFKVAPDYEMPADDNGDNVYKVTLVATDGNMTGKRDISITVTNEDELGKVTLSPEQPHLGGPVMADLKDPDGGVTITSWRWYWADDAATDDFSTITDAATGGRIDDATTSSYTPVNANDGKFLQVVVIYTDEFGTPDPLRKTTDNAVLVDPATKKTPRFSSLAMERRVAENTPMDGAVGAPVMATDEDDEMVVYSLEGTDSVYFKLQMYDHDGEPQTDMVATGQILVGDTTMLDYEKKNSYNVVVKAMDDDTQSATTRVTIRVTNVDEAPMFPDDAVFEFDTEEGGTGAVTTFKAPDPEGSRVIWDVMGTDAAHFTISSSGTLVFKESPDFERPMDSDHPVSTTDATNDPENPVNNNQYVIFVRATGASHLGSPAKSTMRRVQVNVMDKEETVTINLRQPEIGVPLTASATDPDGATGQNPTPSGMVDTAITNATWQWAKSIVNDPMIGNNNHWTNIDAATNATYTPVLADNDRYLRVQATYEDRGDTGKMANGVTEFRVREALLNNGSPDIIDDGMRTIAETAMVDDMVGAAIDVSEPNPEDQGKLTFALVSAAEPTSSTPELGINVDARADDINYFAIDKATGQISVKGKLDYEAESPPDGDGAAGVYVVRVTVRDPSGAPLKAIDVTITVTDVNEPPVIGDMGAMEITVAEHTGDGAYTALTAVTENSYGATDPELNAVNWNLVGDDADAFEVRGHPTTLGNRRINFTTPPDYEMPADKDGDNVYKVTLVATDGSMEGRRDIRITVTNEAEAGKVTLSADQPHLGVPLTATLTDPDGVLTIVSWAWVQVVDGPDDTEIPTATTNMYTPVDDDEGKFLKVTATYRDGRMAVDDSGNPENQKAEETSDNAVLAAPAENNAPTFPRSVETRMVSENVSANGIVGEPVMAMDEDKGDLITYSLEGSDKDAFALTTYDHDDDSGTDVIATGQIVVGNMPMFDYEKKSSYVVDVAATDNAGKKAMVRVTINVTDFNEPPTAPMALSSDFDIVGGRTSRNYEEGMTVPVDTYQAAGTTAGASVSWMLTGDDMDDFMLSSSGVLTFSSTPDYEMPMDADTDNVYEITLEADDGTNMATENVTVTVTNMDEDGTVTLSVMQPVVGTPLVATLTDLDNVVVSSVIWKWSREDTGSAGTYMVIAGENTDTYTPSDDDAGAHLRVTAMYTDGHGSGKSKEAVSAKAVDAEGTGDPLLAKYDKSGDGKIDLDEALGAVATYFVISRSDALPEAKAAAEVEVLVVVARYFSDRRGAS